MFRSLMAAALLCTTAFAGHDSTPSMDWESLRKKNDHFGFSTERWNQTLDACRRNGLSVAETELLLCPVYTAHEEQIPAECILLKIEEGLAKRVPWQEIRPLACRRLQCLQSAYRVVKATGPVRGRQHHHLVQHICMAIESGLPEELFQKILARPGRVRYGRLVHLVEAGEALHLAGLSAEHTEQIMNDCLDRALSGKETLRVMSVVMEKHLAGVDFETLRPTLWVNSN